MKVAILDDWFDTLRTLPCFETLAGHDVTVFTDHVQETEALAARLQGFDVARPAREPTATRAQRTACLTSSLIRASSAAVSSFNA